MSKIYTDKWMCECMGKPCDYFEQCSYPPVYCDSHYKDGIEVREHIKGMRDSGGIVTFKNNCRRDDEIFKISWNEKMLKDYVSMVKEKFPELQCDFDELKLELCDFGVWENREVENEQRNQV